MDTSYFHHPQAWERAIMNRLLAEDFSGRVEISHQLATCLVSNDSAFDGGFELLIVESALAPVAVRVPASIAAFDVDNVPITADLHVVSGIAYMVQILKADGTNIKRLPIAWLTLHELLKERIRHDS